MSLKHFHIVFLFFAILCDAGFWWWTRTEHAAELGVAGLGMFAGWTCLGLLVYGLWYVFKKCRSIVV